jgi:hypothetical protein
MLVFEIPFSAGWTGLQWGGPLYVYDGSINTTVGNEMYKEKGIYVEMESKWLAC